MLKVRSIWSRQSIETLVKECPREKSLEILYYSKGFLGGAMVKNLPASVKDTRDMDLIPGWGRYPGGGNSSKLQYSCLEKSTDKRSLAGYSPWGSNESDMNGQLSTCYSKLQNTVKESNSFSFDKKKDLLREPLGNEMVLLSEEMNSTVPRHI